MTAAYDARDRMIAWGRMRAGYRSDGKRAWKIILDESGAEVSRKYFLYDGDNLLCELDGQLRVTSTSTWGANGLVSRATNTYDGSGNPTDGKTTFYAYDERGSVAERVVDNGSGSPVVNHVAFDAWGYGTAGDSVGFGGQWGYYTDTETGLILCTHRYYDPSKQRWVTRDPISYPGGVNLYGYVGNNPTNSVDPWGLLPNLISTGGASARVDSSTFVFDNERSFYNGHITVTGSGTVKVQNALHTIFSTPIGQRMLRAITRKNLKIWIYTGDYKLGQTVFGSTLTFAGTFTDVSGVSGCNRVSAIMIETNNHLWSDMTGKMSMVPFDAILLHELGHATFKYEDYHGSGVGDNVDLVENPYRKARGYAPRIKYIANGVEK